MTSSMLLLLLMMMSAGALANSEGEKWSWPTSAKDRSPTNRRDTLYEPNGDEKAGRIRVPTSFYDTRR